jgi:hypothetical protein
MIYYKLIKQMPKKRMENIIKRRNEKYYNNNNKIA